MTKNEPNITRLLELLDEAKSVAQAVYDNAIDDRQPIKQTTATEIQVQIWNINRFIRDAAVTVESMPPI